MTCVGLGGLAVVFLVGLIAGALLIALACLTWATRT